MTMTTIISGVLPIAHTPFLDNDSIDFESLRRQIDWAFSVGADGFGTGMVSELLRLTFHERVALTEALGEINQRRELGLAAQNRLGDFAGEFTVLDQQGVGTVLVKADLLRDLLGEQREPA